MLRAVPCLPGGSQLHRTVPSRARKWDPILRGLDEIPVCQALGKRLDAGFQSTLKHFESRYILLQP